MDEREHYYVCKACGQAVDMRRLGDVLHHEDKGHEPLPLVTAFWSDTSLIGSRKFYPKA